MTARLRTVIADDERPARSYLAALLRSFDDIEVVGEAADGLEAVRLIDSLRPDVALLDLQMPELTGLEVVRVASRAALPLVIFVTAHDEYAVRAFDLHAVDYLLKPVDGARLRTALNRASDRLERAEQQQAAAHLDAADAAYREMTPASPLERIPIRTRDDVVIVPVAEVVSIVADGELLHIQTTRNERFTLTYRLKDLDARLDPARFIRLGRGILVAIDAITRVHAMPGGTHTVTLRNGQQLPVSRMQSRVLRETLLKL